MTDTKRILKAMMIMLVLGIVTNWALIIMIIIWYFNKGE